MSLRVKGAFKIFEFFYPIFLKFELLIKIKSLKSNMKKFIERLKYFFRYSILKLNLKKLEEINAKTRLKSI